MDNLKRQTKWIRMCYRNSPFLKQQRPYVFWRSADLQRKLATPADPGAAFFVLRSIESHRQYSQLLRRPGL